jgi:hypothetical protein
VLDQMTFLQKIADTGKAEPAEGRLPRRVPLSVAQAGALLAHCRGRADRLDRHERSFRE